MRIIGLFFGLTMAVVGISAHAQDDVVGQFKKTSTPPVIDGLGDDPAWENAFEYNMETSEWFALNGEIEDEEDLSVSFKGLWDDEHLYVYVQVTDDEIVNDENCNWDDDSAEIYIDAQNTDAPEYRPDMEPDVPAFQFTAIAGNNVDEFCAVGGGGESIEDHPSAVFTQGINSYDGNFSNFYEPGSDTSKSVILDDNTYTLEAAFPWEALDETPTDILARNGEFGFGIAVNDDDGEGSRAGQLYWEADSTELWHQADLFPTAQLVEDDAGAPGDYNNNGSLDAGDLDIQSQAIKDNDLAFDLNGDGVTDINDRIFWTNELKNTWMGDSDLNGEFDSSDFVLVFGVGKYETGQMAGWAEGDWNADMVFDTSDFVVAFANGGYEMGPRPGGVNPAVAAVPEPSALVLFGMGLLLITRVRRK